MVGIYNAYTNDGVCVCVCEVFEPLPFSHCAACAATQTN